MPDTASHLKILMVAPTPFFADRGTHIRILEEARALSRRGHSVKIVTYHIGGDIPREEDPGIDIRRIRRLLFWYRKLEAGPDWQKLILDFLLVRKTYTMTRAWKPDVVHAHLHEGVAIAWAALLLPRLLGQRPKVVADFHGSLTREMVSHSYLRTGPLRHIFRRLETWIDGIGDAAVASSWAGADEISEARGEAVEAVLDGARIIPTPGGAERLRLRKRYGVPDRATVATYTGAFLPNKGIEVLVRSIPEACRAVPALHFVLAGFPKDQLDPLLERYGVSENVTVVSPLPYFSLDGILGMSDIGLEPKHDDTGQASGKMLQYMGAGLPVVCFGTRNNREYLGDGGAYAEEPTPCAFAGAIVSLSGTGVLSEGFADRNRKRAAGMGWDRTGETLERIYRDTISK